MKKIWYFIVGAVLLLLYLGTKKSRTGNVQKAKKKIKDNNRKIKNLRRKKVNEKHFHDMSNKSLVSELDRFSNKRRNKQK